MLTTFNIDKHNGFYFAYIATTALCGFIASTLVVNLIYKFSITTTPISSMFRYATIISMLSCTLCIFGDLSQFVCSFILEIDLLSQRNIITIVIANIFYYIGCIVFYIILIMRVYRCFKNTIWELNKCLFFVLWLLIIISTLTSIYHILVMIFAPNIVIQSNLKQPAFMILLINDGILNIVLCSLFVYKLRECSIERQRTADHKASLTIHSKKTLEVVVRYSILFGSAIISNQFFYTSAFIVSSYPSANNIVVGMVYQLRSLENLWNVIVLFLSMRINHFLYIKMCRICDTHLLKCCQRNVKKRAMSVVSISDSYVVQTDRNVL